jgi:hypothetical protein
LIVAFVEKLIINECGYTSNGFTVIVNQNPSNTLAMRKKLILFWVKHPLDIFIERLDPMWLIFIKPHGKH